MAHEHLTLRPEGLVRIALKRPFRDGTVAVDMDPLSLLCRLAAAVPPPRQHRWKLAPLAALRFARGPSRYAGVLAPAATVRPKVIPPPPHDLPEDGLEPAAAPSPNDGHRCRYRPWAELLRRTFGVDVEVCPACGSRMKLLTLVRDPEGIARFLTALGLPTTAPALAPARAPPYWQSHVLRRKAQAQDHQLVLDLTT